MRIYDVGNTARVGFWCAAPDAETAKQLALAAGHGKKLANLRATDVADHFLAQDPKHHDAASIRSVLDGTRTGRVIGRAHSVRMDEVFRAIAETGHPPPSVPTRWEILDAPQPVIVSSANGGDDG